MHYFLKDCPQVCVTSLCAISHQIIFFLRLFLILSSFILYSMFMGLVSWSI